MNDISFGFDVGIASVGWAVIKNEDKTIIERGVRLFSTVDDPKNSKLLNEQRREKRSIRRQLSRRKTRKRDFVKFLVTEKFIDGNINQINNIVEKFVSKYITSNKEDVYELREKAMKEKISFASQLKVLYFYLSKRGYTYDVTASEKKLDKKEKDILKEIEKNKEENEGLLPIDSQMKYFKKHGYLKGSFNRSINNEDWNKEVNKFLEIQHIDEKLKKEFLKIYKSKRSFEEGPSKGNINAQSNYGLYRWENGKPNKEFNNVWESTVGTCSIYNGKNGRDKENRAIKGLLSCELFNLLNDLNNVKLNGEKLSESDKEKILLLATDFTISKDGKYKAKPFTWDLIAKIVDPENKKAISKGLIKGYRIDSSGKELITKLTSFHDVNKIFCKINNETLTLKKDQLKIDQIITILSSSKDIDKREATLIKKGYAKNIAAELSLIKKPYSETHSLSLRAILDLNPILLKENKNQMEIIYETYGRSIKQFEFNEKNKYVPINWIETEIYAPSVRRALRQTIHVLNALLKKYKEYKVDSIFVEMTRESNNEAHRKNETNKQKYREKTRNTIKEQILGLGFHPSSKLIEKIWLYEQQCSMDAYTGEELDIKRIIKDQNYVDVDHIIPYSQSFDNSRHNKALTLQKNNAEKGNRTPKQYLGEAQFSKMYQLWGKWTGANGEPMANDKKAFADDKKIEYLATTVNFKDPNNQVGFIGRNLVDTSYVAKTFRSCLEEFFKFKNKDTKIKTINGKMTSYTRFAMVDKNKNLDLNRPSYLSKEDFVNVDDNGKKSRLWHGHHSEDASIVALIGLYNYRLQKQIEKAISAPYLKKDAHNYVGDKLSEKFENKIDYNHIREELNRTVDHVRFSRMKNIKTNTQFYNETLYGTKIHKESGKVWQIVKKNLLDLEKKDCEKYFDPESNKSNNVLLKEGDHKTYNQLVNIFENYKDKKTPFKAALEDVNKNNDFKEESIFVLSSKKNKKTNEYTKIYIKNIKIKKAEKNISDVQIVSEENNSFYETFNWLKLEIFKNDKDKYVIIPIDVKVAYFPIEKGKPINYKKDKYEKLLAKNNIINKAPIWTFDRGQCFQDENNNVYYLVGVNHKQCKLELKPLQIRDKKQTQYTINTKLKKWKIIDIDILGKFFVGEEI